MHKATRTPQFVTRSLPQTRLWRNARAPPLAIYCSSSPFHAEPCTGWAMHRVNDVGMMFQYLDNWLVCYRLPWSHRG